MNSLNPVLSSSPPSRDEFGGLLDHAAYFIKEAEPALIVAHPPPHDPPDESFAHHPPLRPLCIGISHVEMTIKVIDKTIDGLVVQSTRLVETVLMEISEAEWIYTVKVKTVRVVLHVEKR